MNAKTIFTAVTATALTTLLTFGGLGVATASAEPSVADTQAMTTLATTVPIELTHVHGLAYSADGKQLLIPSHHGIAAYANGQWSQLIGPEPDYMGFAKIGRETCRERV